MTVVRRPGSTSKEYRPFDGRYYSSVVAATASGVVAVRVVAVRWSCCYSYCSPIPDGSEWVRRMGAIESTDGPIL